MPFIPISDIISSNNSKVYRVLDNVNRHLTSGNDENVASMQNANQSFMASVEAPSTVKISPIPNSPFGSKRYNVVYCYGTDYAGHAGKVKIGSTHFTVESGEILTSEQIAEQTLKAAKSRISDQAKTIAVKTDIFWAEATTKPDVTDKRVHALLGKQNIKRYEFDYDAGQEWFEITPEEAHSFYLEAATEGTAATSDEEPETIVLRKEQQAFVDNTLEAYYKGDVKRLWNAKMRFGKTPTAFSLIKKTIEDGIKPMEHNLILTHRPVVNDGWYKAHKQILKGLGFSYSSKDSAHGTFSFVDKDGRFVHFVSMQDLRGKDKTFEGFKESNKAVFETDWDLVIIDEAHEGNETSLATEVHEQLKRKFTLLLSGTPFKYLSEGEFEEHQIDTWDYVNEQAAKESWSIEHPEKPNPYEGLAKIWISALDIRSIVKNQLAGSDEGSYDEGSFNFKEMFRVEDDKFVYEDDINKFLDVISASGEVSNGDGAFASTMPYSPTRVEQSRHALFVLPGVAECKHFEILLASHPFFNKYAVVNVAGNESKATKKPLEALKAAMGASPEETQTITLTVGRLTTGVTVEPWTACIMLANTESAASYMQTIFRVQSPYTKSNGEVKTDAFVYDFAPDRVLKVFTDVADVSVKAGSHNSERTQTVLGNMLNYMPIISQISAEDITVFTADKVTRELKRVYTRRVLEAGFDSNLLFAKSLEKLPAEIRQVLEEIKLAAGGKFPDTKQKVDNSITIADNGLAKAEYKELEKVVTEISAKPKKELSPEEIEQLKAYRAELDQRKNIRAILKTISVRLPFMIISLMGDEEFKNNKLSKNFSLEDFVSKFDEASWSEFFGKITKEKFLSLEPAFDKEILQSAVTAWIEEVDKVIGMRESDTEAFMDGVSGLLSRIKNPDKETVFTPSWVAELVYSDAGFNHNIDWLKVTSGNVKDGGAPTFYDINIKSGIFPLIAAHNLYKVSLKDQNDKHWERSNNDSIYANSRTYAAKWATCTLLGMPKDWNNITVIDIYKELEAEDINSLSNDGKNLFLSHFLLSPLNRKDNSQSVLSDISNVEERASIIKIIEAYEKEKKALEKNNMSQENKTKSKKDLESRVKKELNTSKQFDYVISNPPYQINLTETTSKAKPIWQHFLILASQISKHVAMINPARWQKGGQGTGLLGVKEWLMENENFHKVINMPSAEIFPTASIAGDVSIEVIDNTKTFANPKIGTWNKTNGWSELKDFILTEYIDIPLSEQDSDIVKKIASASIGSNFEKELWIGGENNELKKITSNATNRGGSNKRNYTVGSQRMIHDTDYFITKEEMVSGVDYVKIWYNEKSTNTLSARYVPLSEFVKSERNDRDIPKWKSLIPKTGANFFYRNMGPVGEPNSLSTNTWVCRSFDTKADVEGYNSYIKTYLYRYLVALRIVSHIATANIHRFVPDLKDIKNPRTGKVGYKSDWIDDDLVILLKDVLTVEDWKHIKATALAADKGKGDYEAGWLFPDGNSHHSLTLPKDTSEGSTEA